MQGYGKDLTTIMRKEVLLMGQQANNIWNDITPNLVVRYMVRGETKRKYIKEI